MQIGFHIGLATPPKPSTGNGLSPVIRLDGNGYAGSFVRSSKFGRWYADGLELVGKDGDALFITPDLEGAEIYQTFLPQIFLDGSGLAGTVYRSNIAGQWLANDAPIPEAIGDRWTMTPEYEGAEISLNAVPVVWFEGDGFSGSAARSNAVGEWLVGGVNAGFSDRLSILPEYEGKEIQIDAELDFSQMKSNTIQIFAPVTLSAALKAGGGHWASDTVQKAARGGVEYVAAMLNRFSGGANFAQVAAANQPKLGDVGGQVAAIWDKSPAYQSLDLSASAAFKWGIIVAQFGNGAVIASAAVTGGASSSYLLSRGGGQANAVVFASANLPASNLTDGGVRVNGAEALTPPASAVLPLAVGSVSFAFNSSNQGAAAWGLGRGYDVDQNRQWVGSIFGAVFLADVPDAATRQKIEGYMHWKYGVQASLPAAHPYRHSPPRVQ